jgi:methylamine dehydrogenase accessory protein MauD
MTGLSLVGRLVLAAVFGAAGVAKLFDRQGSRRALADFGVPEHLAQRGATLLPLSELAVAGMLVPSASARLGALGALGLLVVFSTAIVVNLARGRTPDCHCFGQIHSAPIGPALLVRNGVLAALGALVAWRPGAGIGSALSWYGDLRLAERVGAVAIAVLAGAVVVLAWVVFELLRQQGRLVLRLDALEALTGDRSEYEGLPVGSVAPSFALPSLSGETVTSEALLAPGRPLVLVFVHSNCSPCAQLLPSIGRWQRSDTLTIALVAAGEREINRARAEEHHLGGVLVENGQKVAAAYRTTATPSAVLIGPDGRIQSPVVAGGAAIEKLLLRAPDTVARARATSHEIELTDGLVEGRQAYGYTL